MRTIILNLSCESDFVKEYFKKHGCEVTHVHRDRYHQYTITIMSGGWERYKKFLLGHLSREGVEGESLYMEHREMGKRVKYVCEEPKRFKVEYESLFLSYESVMVYSQT